MICPICKKPLSLDHDLARETAPFCSERCKLIDLGRWLSGKYSIPVELPSDSPAESDGPPEQADGPHPPV